MGVGGEEEVLSVSMKSISPELLGYNIWGGEARYFSRRRRKSHVQYTLLLWLSDGFYRARLGRGGDGGAIGRRLK